MSVNSQTQEFHTEEYYTYTIINIPQQELRSKNNTLAEYIFIFQLNDKQIIEIPLKSGISFILSGKYLTHRQSSNYSLPCKDVFFINFISYGSNCFYRHTKK